MGAPNSLPPSVSKMWFQVIRQSARGFYSDPILAEGPDIRLFGRCTEAFKQLKVPLPRHS